MTIKRFEDVELWKDARSLANSIYGLTENFKDYSLKDQMRRSAVSVMANIAEGFSRSGNAEFIQFLYIAKGSISELKSHLYIALDRNFINTNGTGKIIDTIEDITNKIGGFINYLKKSGIKGLKYK